jgi:flavin reductase (DIM6/NTAB) family NADH-FMN oxidoreductase RutF
MSRINFGPNPFLYPMPVLIVGTYDENGVPNAMNAAWGAITDMNEITISMSPHKTTENLKCTGDFTVSFATCDTIVACDYVGVETAGRVPDKFARAGFHAVKSEFVNAPCTRIRYHAVIDVKITIASTEKTVTKSDHKKAEKNPVSAIPVV